MDAQALYLQLGRMVEAMPNFTAPGEPTAETLRWVGRAFALISALGRADDEIAFAKASKSLASTNMLKYDYAVKEISVILYRALALAELQAPASAQGAFIPAGNSFDAMAAVAKVLREAKQNVLIVDPYLDDRVLTDFAPSAPQSVTIRLLADQADHKPSLQPAAMRWMKQHGNDRPLEVRLAPPKALHDRLIVVDDAEVWLVTQSFNGIAVRSPATIVKVEGDAAELKLSAFQAVWDSATPLI